MASAGVGIRGYPSCPEVAEIPPLPVNYINQLVEEKFGVFLNRMGLEYPGLLSDFMLASMSDSSQGRFLKTISSAGFPVDARLNKMLSLGSFLLAKPPPSQVASLDMGSPAERSRGDSAGVDSVSKDSMGKDSLGSRDSLPKEQLTSSSGTSSSANQVAATHMPHRRALIRFSRLAKSSQPRGPAGKTSQRSEDTEKGNPDGAPPLFLQASSADRAWSISQVSYEHLGDFVYSNDTVRSLASTAPLTSSTCASSRPCNPGALPPRGFYELEVVISINPELVDAGAICPLIFNLVEQAICRVTSFFDPTGSSSFMRQSLETRSRTTIYIASPSAVIHPCADQDVSLGSDPSSDATKAKPVRSRPQKASQNVPDYGNLDNTVISEINPILAWHGILAALRLSLECLTRYRQFRSLLDVVLQSSSYPDQFLLLHMLPAYFPRTEADVMFSTAWTVFDEQGRYLIRNGAQPGIESTAPGQAPRQSGPAGVTTGEQANIEGTSDSTTRPSSTVSPKPAMDTETFLRSACNGRLIRAADSISGRFTAPLAKTSNQIVLYRSAPGRDSRFSEKLSNTISNADLKAASHDGIVVSLSAPLSTAMPAYGVFANKIDKNRPQKTVDALYWLVRLVGLYSGGPFLLVWFCGWPEALKELPKLVEGFPVSFFDRIRLVVVGAPSGTRQNVLRSFLGGTLLAKGYSEKTLKELYQDYPHLVFGTQVSEWNRENGGGSGGGGRGGSSGGKV